MRLSVPEALILFAFLPTPESRAQTYGTWPIRDANVSFRMVPPTTAIGSGGPADLRVAGTADHLFQSQWYYRIAGDTRESVFNSGNSQLEQGIGERGASLFWADADGRGLEARLCLAVFSTGPSSGLAMQTMTVTNNTSSSLWLNLFSYVDLDVCGTNNTAARLAPLNQHEVIGACGTRACFLACGADRYEVAQYSTLLQRLNDTYPDTLGDTGLPFSGDYTGAYQWQDRYLQPGESLTAQVVLSVDFVPPTCVEALAEMYGPAQAGSFGPPVLHSRPPVAGTTNPIEIEGGYPGVRPILVLGGSEAFQPFPFGTLLVGAPLVLTVLAPFTPSLNTRLDLALPLDPALYGATLTMQSFWFDPGALASLAHTGGLAWLFGAPCCGHERIRIRAGAVQSVSVGFLNRVKSAVSRNPAKCTAAPSPVRPDLVDITAVAGAHGPTHVDIEYTDPLGVRWKVCVHVRVIP